MLSSAVLDRYPRVSDSDKEAAAELLGMIGKITPEAAAALGAAVADPESCCRHEAAEALAACGKSAAPAKDALRAAMETSSQVYRVHAAEAYWHVSGDAGPVVSRLLQIARQDGRDRSHAARALLRMTPEAPGSVKALAELLARRHSSRGGIAKRLIELGAAARDALPILEAAPGKEDDFHIPGVISFIKVAVELEALGVEAPPASRAPAGAPGEFSPDDDF
jgi:hypothetical protein